MVVQEKDNMAYADFILRENIKKVLYSEHSSSDEGMNVRPRWADGTPAHTKYVTAVTNKYNLSRGEYPLTTLRPIAWKTALGELLWIYQDKSNDVALLKEKYNVHYWDSWTNSEGNLGTAYGYQINKLVEFPEGSFSQIDRVIHLLKTDPMNRRIMTSMIDMEEMKDMTLVPCAFMTLWSVRGGHLDMTLIQRSNDLIAAQAINAFQYTALLMMIAAATGYEPGIFTHFIQNMHIYDRHEEIAKKMLVRTPRPQGKIILSKKESFYDFKVSDFTLEGYFPHEQIKGIPIAI